MTSTHSTRVESQYLGTMNARNMARALAGAVVGVISLVLILPAVAVLAPFWVVDLLAKKLQRLLKP